ncbi:MAG TPA: hypothetical protein GX715_01865 [Armatimonadetes bacterium]|jgi:twitching motility two-component system response regulator PilH|nr:hypothetical protein [Armatimonadota bacterium]HPO72606.1 hypothetical protein [Armatimonadota bacterium]
MPTVLVVDEERAECGKLRAACEDAGFAMMWAESVAEAVGCVQQQAPAAILVAGAKPGDESGKTVSLLRRNPRTGSIPLVLLCEPNGNSLVEGWNSDADMVLEKPVDPVELFTVIRHLMAAPR